MKLLDATMEKIRTISNIEAKHKGLTRYYTGIPCKHGHISERLTANRTCVVCQSEATARRKKERYHTDADYRKSEITRSVKARKVLYRTNAGFRARISELNKKYYSINPEKYLERNKKWMQDNPERTKEYARKWAEKSYIANPDKYRRKSRDWRESNLEEANARTQDWQKNNKAIVNAHTGKRRAMKLSATPKWSDDEKIKTMYKDAQRLGMHVDHVLPLNSNYVCGLHVHNNLQLLTPRQNLSKGNKIPMEVMCAY